MTTLRWEVVVGKEMGEEGGGEEVRGGGSSIGGGFAFSSGIFLSVVLSFLFSPLLSRSMDGDTVIKALRGQTIWPRQWPPVRGGGGEGRGGGGTGPQGKRGQNGALVYRARTLYSITPLFRSLRTHSLSFASHTPL